MTTSARHCPRCGAGLPGHPPTTCGACGYQLFVNARPTATVVIVQDRRFLAVRRAIEPRVGWWDMPGGFCDGWEHPADAAVREAREELGVEVRLGDFVGMFIGTYEFQGEAVPALDCFWLADITAGEIVLDESENSAFAWLPLDDPPELAFPTMNRAVDAARALLG